MRFALRTLVKVLMTDGTKAAKKITMILAASDSPSQTMANGIQAKGGIGRMRRKTGLKKASTCLSSPIAKPSGTPIATATRKPPATSLRLCQTCSRSVPPA